MLQVRPKRYAFLGHAFVLLGCENGGGAATDDVMGDGSTNSSASGSDTDGSESGDGETGESAECVDRGGVCSIEPSSCQEPPPPAVGENVPTYGMVEFVSTNIDTMSDCPVAAQIAAADPVNGLEPTLFFRTYHPDDGNGGLPLRDAGYGLLVFSHGNNQSGATYFNLMETVVSRGLVAVSIYADSNVGGPLRKHRLMCLAEAILDGHVDANWIASGALSGDYAFAGHSQGGRGAYLAVKEALSGNIDFLPEHELVGALSIAPAGVDAGDEVYVGGRGPFFMVIQASGDGDTSGQGFSHYDQVRAIENGGEVLGAPRKAAIWSYGVEHSHWGGGNLGDPECVPTEKADRLIEGYIGPFIEASFYEDPAALDVFFSADEVTPVIVDDVSDPGLWLSEYAGEPQIYGNSSQRVSPEDGFEAYAIDRFENGDLTVSDSGLTATVAATNFSESDSDGGGFFDNYHLTNAGVFDLTQDLSGAFPDFIDWCLSCDAKEALISATSITFRIGFERGMNEQTCEGEVYPLPELRLNIETEGGGEGSVDVSSYARLSLPDTKIEQDNCSDQGDGCHTFNSLQATVRVPMAAFCEAGIVLEEATHIRLEFSSPNPVAEGFGTLLLIDDFELRRVPGEPPVSCRCG